jgi:hypothetical protein
MSAYTVRVTRPNGEEQMIVSFPTFESAKESFDWHWKHGQDHGVLVEIFHDENRVMFKQDSGWMPSSR